MNGYYRKCPKCGQFFLRKHQVRHGGEYLEYRCRCGYVIITPTLDADPDEARRQWERRLGQWVLAGQQDNFPEPPPFMDEAWTRYAEELKQWVWEEKLWNYNGRVGFLPKPPVKPSEKKEST